MDRMKNVFQIVGVMVLLGISFASTLPVASTHAIPPKAPKAFMGAADFATSASCATVAPHGRLATWRVPGGAHEHETLVVSGTSSSRGLPSPQHDVAIYLMLVAWLCFVEEESCFRTCAAQADDLQKSGDLDGTEADEFRAQCNEVCWNNCGEEGKD